MRVSRTSKIRTEAEPDDHLTGTVLETPWKQRLRTENEHVMAFSNLEELEIPLKRHVGRF